MSHQSRAERICSDLSEKGQIKFQFRVGMTRPGNDEEVFTLKATDHNRPMHYAETSSGNWVKQPLPADNTPSRWVLESQSRDFRLTIMNGGNIAGPDGKPFRAREVKAGRQLDNGVTIADLSSAGTGVTFN